MSGWTLLAALIFVMCPGPGRAHPWGMLPFLWDRITETDAEKSERLLRKSQRLLEKARMLTTHSKSVESAIDDEFARRLRLVSGED